MQTIATTTNSRIKKILKINRLQGLRGLRQFFNKSLYACVYGKVTNKTIATIAKYYFSKVRV